MKKILSILVMAVIAIQFTSAKEIVTQDEKKLPTEARNFISQNFSDIKISYIKIDEEFLQSKKYEVTMTNGVELEFDSKGNWTEIDFKRQEIPASIIPARINDYITTNWKNNYITKIERERKGYEVELNNDLSVKFDLNQNFLRLDD